MQDDSDNTEQKIIQNVPIIVVTYYFVTIFEQLCHDVAMVVLQYCENHLSSYF